VHSAPTFARRVGGQCDGADWPLLKRTPPTGGGELALPVRGDAGYAGYYPPLLNGMRGPSWSFESAHALRDGVVAPRV